MTNKYPTNDPNGKTGEEFLESIANSLRNLPSIKYLADEVSKLKKSSKFATGATQNAYGTGGYVTPPPPMSTTSNKVSFFASDMNWYSDIKAAILLENMSQTDDYKYDILGTKLSRNSGSSPNSLDTGYHVSDLYADYIDTKTSSLTDGVLYAINDPDLGPYSGVSGNYKLLRFNVGTTAFTSELKIGKFIDLVTDLNNGASRPTAALVMGNLNVPTGSPTYSPYIAKVIGNDFTIYRKNDITSFGSGSILNVSPYYSDESSISSLKKQWYFKTTDDRYIGMLMDTPFAVRKGNMLHTWQPAAKNNTGSPGAYQRYANGVNMFFAKNGFSLLNATYNATSGDISVSNELTMTMPDSNRALTYMSQYGNFVFGTINKPNTVNRNDIGDIDSNNKFTLYNKFLFGRNGAVLSTNLNVNSNVLTIRALNDGSADPLSAEVVSTLPESSNPSSTYFNKIYKVTGNSNPNLNGYWRCKITPNKTQSGDPIYKWVRLSDPGNPDDCEYKYGVNWGNDTWSSSPYNRASTAQLRFYGPYDRSLAYNDNQGLFFDRRILGGNDFMGIQVNNAKQESVFSTVSYSYTQSMQIMSWLNNITSVSSMPTAQKSLVGKIYKYIGVSGTYTPDTYYHCEYASNGYRWVALSNSMVQNKAGSKCFMDFMSTYNVNDSDLYLASSPSYKIKFGNNIYIDFNHNGLGNVLNIDVDDNIKSSTMRVTDTLIASNVRIENAAGIRNLIADGVSEFENNVNVINSDIQLYNATGSGKITIKPTDSKVYNDNASIAINGGVFEYVGTGFSGLTQGGTQQDDGGTRWVVRPIIIATNTKLPADNQTGSGNWATVPNGVIAMGI